MDLFDLRDPFSALSHGAGLVLSILGTRLLWRRCRGDLASRLSVLVYGLSLCACYAASTLFHGVRASADRLERLYLLDHIGIFLLIAGTFTPIVWNLTRGRWRRNALGLVWLAAVAGIVLQATCRWLPAWACTGQYLALGWSALLCLGELARTIPRRLLRPILLGGLLYSVGAVLDLARWPVLWPGAFESHELFHLFVLAGSLAHFRFVLHVVVPLSRGQAAVAQPAGVGTEPAPLPAVLRLDAAEPVLGAGLARPRLLARLGQWTTRLLTLGTKLLPEMSELSES